MHERKELMADLSDAFIALPGGFGTLEEFCEIVTCSQLGLHAKLRHPERAGILLAAARDVQPCDAGTLPEAGEQGARAGA